MASWLSCSETCGIFLDKGSNPCPLHWQVDSYPLHHQGSPEETFFFSSNFIERKVFFLRIVGIDEKKKSVQRRLFQVEGDARTRV